MLQFFIGTLLTLSSLFLIALVLIQQGKGGGLAGAFGGAGGQSAFGTKAGDVFTRVTIITALVWIFFCMLAIKLISKDAPRRSADKLAPAPAGAPLIPGAPATGTTPSGTPPSAATSSDKGATPAATTPDPMAPTTGTPGTATPETTPMTPAGTAPATTPEAATPPPVTPSTPTPSTPATPEGK